MQESEKHMPTKRELENENFLLKQKVENLQWSLDNARRVVRQRLIHEAVEEEKKEN